MSRWAVTGGTGLVGRFIVADLLKRGCDVVVLGRHAPTRDAFHRPVGFQPYDLNAPDAVDLSGYSGLVHAAFDHLPGRYRGGEGNDPDGFARRNLDGSLALFAHARRDGVRRAIFLSSRAVYGDYPAGTSLSVDLTPRPDTLYGKAKHAVEQGLARLNCESFVATSLRATGVYGLSAPGQPHKWTALFADHLAGTPIAPRVATEVHGHDLAAAVWLTAGLGGVWNVSDLMLDRHDLLAAVNAATGLKHALPPKSQAAAVSEMECTPLRALGWTPRGWAGLLDDLPGMLRPRT